MQVKPQENEGYYGGGWQQQQLLEKVEQYYNNNKDEEESREVKGVSIDLESESDFRGTGIHGATREGIHAGAGQAARPRVEQRIYSDESRRVQAPPDEGEVECPRCSSTDTKFCYYNNYSLLQPRYYCKACRRYWTKGGSLRNVPVGSGKRRLKRASSDVSQTVAAKLAMSVDPSLSPSPSPSTTSPIVLSPMSPPSPSPSPPISFQPLPMSSQLPNRSFVPANNHPSSSVPHPPAQHPSSLPQPRASSSASSSLPLHTQYPDPSVPLTSSFPLGMHHSYSASSLDLHLQQPHSSAPLVTRLHPTNPPPPTPPFSPAPALTLSSPSPTNIYNYNSSVQVPSDSIKGHYHPSIPCHPHPQQGFYSRFPYMSHVGGQVNHHAGVYSHSDRGNHDYYDVNPIEEQLISNADYIQGDPDIDTAADANESGGFKGFSLSFDQRYKLKEANPETQQITQPQTQYQTHINHPAGKNPETQRIPQPPAEYQTHINHPAHQMQHVDQANRHMWSRPGQVVLEPKPDSNHIEQPVMPTAAYEQVSPTGLKVKEEWHGEADKAHQNS